MEYTLWKKIHDPPLREIIFECASWNIKNRALLVSHILLGYGIYSGWDIEVSIAFTSWLAMMLTCWMGRATKIYYDRTKNHIKKFGVLDERFFRKLMEWYPGWKFKWYCELQWIYLAARNSGKLNEFRELRKKYGSNVVVPNI